MPNCFQLFRKDAPDKPVVFQELDAELCAHFGAPCDPVQYFSGWYDYVGFATAMGFSPTEIKANIQKIVDERERAGDPDGKAYWLMMERIREYIFERCVANAWYEHKH